MRNLTTIAPFDKAPLDALRARVLAFLETHDGWYTDEEICAAVGNTVNGVGAKRRDLRKREYGEYIIEPRRRGDPRWRVWEYHFAGKVQPVEPEQQELDLAV